jgi:hypothetical protein
MDAVLAGTTGALDCHDQVSACHQLADAYLLALANRRKGVLATLDRGLRTLAGSALPGAPEVLTPPHLYK